MKCTLRGFCWVFMMLPALCFAGDGLLLGFDELAAEIKKSGDDYQLLDARGAEAQRIAPIAFSTKYRKIMPIKKGLVLIVADTDAAALEIAQSIPAGADRNVFAVMGGAETWQRVSREAAPRSTMPDSFVIPANTCEQGKPIQELKRNKPWQELKGK